MVTWTHGKEGRVGVNGETGSVNRRKVEEKRLTKRERTNKRKGVEIIGIQDVKCG